MTKKVCNNCGLIKRHARRELISKGELNMSLSEAYCLWRNEFTGKTLSEKELKTGCKDFMEKVDGWSPERHGEEKLKQFSISNAKFANKISLIAIFISIIALIVAIAVNLA